MKPTLRKAVPQQEQSFIVRKDVGTQMRNSWHYHPDYELLYIKRSIGTWMVGDYVGQFRSGDIILIGPKLPHSFRHEYDYIQERDNKAGEAIVVLFLTKIFGDTLLNLPEIKGVKHILSISERGIKLTGKTREAVANIMESMVNQKPGKKFLDLMRILYLISEGNECKVLASDGFTDRPDSIDIARINAIFEYTFNNYQNQITIEEVAALVNMTKHSFSRYFKEKTKRTYISFLMEVRIGNACRLLIEEDMNVKEVGYSCGYNSISHFNHQFSALKGETPLEYKHHYLLLQAV